jgi:hypothetical protein
MHIPDYIAIGVLIACMLGGGGGSLAPPILFDPLSAQYLADPYPFLVAAAS